MSTQVKQTAEDVAGAVKDVAPGTQREEKQKHRRALFKGRQLIVLSAILLAVFGLVTAFVLLLSPLTLDVPITRAVQEITFGPAGWVLQAISVPGFAPWNFIMPLVVIAGVALIRRFAEAAFLALASVFAGSAEVVKALVHRGRPSASLVHVVGHPQDYSFPSGHVTQYTLFFGFLFYLAFTLLKPGWLRTLILVITGGMVALVGISRIWMGQHWASDVLGGYTLGLGFLLLVIWGYRTWEEKRVKKTTDEGKA